MLADIGADIRFGLRSLLRRPSLTFAALLSLSLGVGANTAIFTLINAFFLQAPPVEQPGRLMAIFGSYGADKDPSGAYLPLSYPDAQDYMAQNHVFSGILTQVPLGLSLQGAEDAEPLSCLAVSANYFQVLGLRLPQGRGFTAEEAALGRRQPVVVLGDSLWRRSFGADPRIIGRTVRLNRRGFTVIGVAPAGFRGLDRTTAVDAWVPLGMFEALTPPEFGAMLRQRDGRMAFLIGRLADGVSPPQAQAAMSNVARRLEQENGKLDAGWGVTILPLTSFYSRPDQRDSQLRARTLTLSVVALVLLIACVNVANLLMVRASERRGELAIRLSIGASRSRLIRETLVESLMLALLGGACGLGVAALGVRFLWYIRPPLFAENSLDLSLNGTVLAFTLALSVLTGFAFGLLPAVKASRTDLVSPLKSSGGRTGSRDGVRRSLVAVQVALCLVCLVCAGLFLRSLRKSQQVDPGFNTHELLLASIGLPMETYDEAKGRQFLHRVVERLGALPGVKSVSFSSTRLLTNFAILDEIVPVGQETNPAGGPNGGQAGSHGETLIRTSNVSPDYFQTVGIPLLHGRVFSAADRPGTPPVAIINEAVAKQLWPGQEATGKRFHLEQEPQPVEVVGIVKDVRNTSMQAPPEPYIYLPAEQRYSSGVTLYLRADPDQLSRLVGETRRQLHALDPAMPMLGLQTISESIAGSLWAARLGTGLLGFFGLLALVLACIGVYGVMIAAVERRRAEIGLRMALGASRGDVFRLVLREAGLVIGAGLLLGLAGTAVTSRLIHGLLYGIEPNDPATLAIVSLSLAAVALLASSLPARRALQTDPSVAIRSST
jgi:macrolide transport system ATP-binding/permease protein